MELPARGNTVPKHNGINTNFKQMAKRTKKVQVEVEDVQTVEIPATVETLPTADVSETQDIAELEAAAQPDDNGRYKDVEVKPGRLLLEEIGTGKEYPPFLIVNALRVKVHADGTATVNGYIRDGKSIKYQIIKKKVV